MIHLPLQLPFPVVSDVSEFRPEKIVTYTLAGAVWNMSGYFNTASKTGEGWEHSKAKRALALGFITGLIVAIMDPDASPTAASFEKWAYLAPGVLDQAKGAWDNVREQTRNNQFGDWADDWFEDGRQPQRGDLEIDPSDDYFDAVAPDDLSEGDAGASADVGAGGGDGDDSLESPE